MQNPVGQTVTLKATPALPFWSGAAAFLLGFTKRIWRALATLRSRTTLVRDPFSPEQNRD